MHAHAHQRTHAPGALMLCRAAVLSLYHRTIPATANFLRRSDDIPAALNVVAGAPLAIPGAVPRCPRL